ncbi:hypothetical protein SISSUDRAFT_1053908, partial [Sistotremastrum suecicum HHB10207 ss-3]
MSKAGQGEFLVLVEGDWMFGERLCMEDSAMTEASGMVLVCHDAGLVALRQAVSMHQGAHDQIIPVIWTTRTTLARLLTWSFVKRVAE